MDFDRTREVLAALEREQVRYVVFGGVALNLQGLARATEELDIFVEPTTDNVERLRGALMSVFDAPHLAQIAAEDLLGACPMTSAARPTGTRMSSVASAPWVTSTNSAAPTSDVPGGKARRGARLIRLALADHCRCGALYTDKDPEVPLGIHRPEGPARR